MIGSKIRERGKSTNKIDEIAFKAWAETGSLDNAYNYFRDQGIVHSNTGRQYSVAGIRFCAMRYMIKNYEVALDHIIEEHERNSVIPNVESIEITIIGYAIEVLKYRSSVIQWAKDHNLYEKYQAYIDERTRNAPVESKRASLIRSLQL